MERGVAGYVDPFIGTAGKGHTFPGATYPLGLIQLSPDTGIGTWDYCAGYQFTDRTVDGFSHTHMSGGGNADLGDVLVLPLSGEDVLAARKATQDKTREVASPGFYGTRLIEDGIDVELSATERSGVHRYTFAPGSRQRVLVSIERVLRSWGSVARSRTYETSLRVDDDRRLSGGYLARTRTERQVGFAIEFDRPMVSHRYLDEERKVVLLDFGEAGEDPLLIRVGLSTVGPESARRNLEVESQGRSFEEIRAAAEAAWERVLSRIEVEGAREHKVAFYSALYRLFIQPNNIADVDGRYRGGDGQVHRVASGRHYSTFALWDTFRAAHPLHTLISPRENVDFMNSLLRFHREAGYLPVWGLWGRDSLGMIGNHAVTVLWDAVNKGLPGIDKEHAYQAIKDTLTKTHWRKHDWNTYDPFGYFPADVPPVESVSRTLETCLNDWCAAQFAKLLGREEDYAFFSRRAQFYRNLFHPGSRFFRGRLADGTWREPFDPMEIFHSGTSGGDYTEGNAWHWLWSVQHDVEGLKKLLGGPAALGDRLDELFAAEEIIYGKGSTNDVSGLIGQYAHGNEPSHHVAYLYNYAGRPGRAQEVIREVLDTQYLNEPDGLSGNDDYGQMGAWHVLSSLGFYPVNPASGVYDLGVPRFAHARVRLGESGPWLDIRAAGFSPDRPYVSRVSFRGKPLSGWRIAHAELAGGGELVFEMSATPPAAGLP